MLITSLARSGILTSELPLTIRSSMSMAAGCAESGAGMGDWGVCANTPADSIAAAINVRILEPCIAFFPERRTSYEQARDRPVRFAIKSLSKRLFGPLHFPLWT